MSDHHAPTDAVATPAASAAPKEGVLLSLSLVVLVTLVLSFATFIRAGHKAVFGGLLPTQLASTSGAVYQKNCASCHGAQGGGGVGPAFTKGAVITTFADPIDQVRWVILGSEGGAQVYAKANKKPKGGMPAWGKTLSLTDIVHAVLYERQEISRKPLAEEATKWAALKDIPTEFASYNFKAADVDALLKEINAAGAAKTAGG